jgi:sodium transport system permease protein
VPAQSLIIARKEILDHSRDIRSLVSSVFYALMGPLVVLLVSLAKPGSDKSGESLAVLAGMMSVFALVAAFVGGNNVAMDAIAGERERRSLLPLLLNPVRRRDVLIGKWLAISLFAACGLMINLLAFAILLHSSWYVWCMIAFGLLPLVLFAAALELLISTVSSNAKEAHTYLSLLVFLPMGVGMFVVFFPQAAGGWLSLFPVIGHQSFIGLCIRGEISPVRSIVLAMITLASASLTLWGAAKMLSRDEVVYGG